MLTNATFLFNLDEAVTGIYPNFALDYAKIRIDDSSR